MAVSWNVVKLVKADSFGSLSDVVTEIHWSASDSEIVGSGDSAVEHIGSSYGSVALADPQSSSFTEYAKITEENAITWLKSALGSENVTVVENYIAEKISKSKNATVSAAVPW
tara:strand:+ start:2052 stop:2390 length:339 start_codon:yes stop_codon:yes gene_type:complete